MKDPSEGHDPLRRSRDHILPRERGGALLNMQGIRNMRTMCASCNSGLAECFHCIAAYACVRTVAADTNASVREVMNLWEMARLTNKMREAIPEECRGPGFREKARRETQVEQAWKQHRAR